MLLPTALRKPTGSRADPQTAHELERCLNEMIAPEKRHRLVAFVIDVAGPE